jgi:hypothetical protein
VYSVAITDTTPFKSLVQEGVNGPVGAEGRARDPWALAPNPRRKKLESKGEYWAYEVPQETVIRLEIWPSNSLCPPAWVVLTRAKAWPFALHFTLRLGSWFQLVASMVTDPVWPRILGLVTTTTTVTGLVGAAVRPGYTSNDVPTTWYEFNALKSKISALTVDTEMVVAENSGAPEGVSVMVASFGNMPVVKYRVWVSFQSVVVKVKVELSAETMVESDDVTEMTTVADGGVERVMVKPNELRLTTKLRKVGATMTGLLATKGTTRLTPLYSAP